MLDLNSVRTFFSEGAKLELSKSDGFKLDYQLQNKDYAGIIVSLLTPELSENFAVEFEIRGTQRKSKFECKLVSSDGTGVWWVVKPDFEINENWQKVSYKRRHFVYAWGASQEYLPAARQIELVLTGNENCQGSFELRNIKLVEISAAKATAENTEVQVSSGNRDFLAKSVPWISDAKLEQSLEMSFKEAIELGGLIINWGDSTATDFDLKIQLIDDSWKNIESIKNFKDQSSFHYIPDTEAKAIRLELHKKAGNENYKINSIEFKGASFSASWNTFLSNVAQRKPRGLYPRYLHKEQSFWTVVADDGSKDKALINEEGLLELGYELPSVDPFIRLNGNLLTWNDSIQSQNLVENHLPIPTVERKYINLTLKITAWMNNAVYASYEIKNTSSEKLTGSLLLALRPFQVNPPWQFLNTTGGFVPVRSLKVKNNSVLINGTKNIKFFSAADTYSASEQDSLQAGNDFKAYSQKGTCSAAFEFNFSLSPGESKIVNLATSSEAKDPELAFNETVKKWRSKLAAVNFSILEDTVKAQLAYILVNRSGAAIQPGTRCYRRTWIRDGAMTSSALLQFGFFKEVKEFIEWFAPNVQDAVPCVVDSRGIDTTPEHDSHGEFLFLVCEYYRFTKDRDLVEKLFPKLLAVANHIKELSSLSLNAAVHIRGLLPKSISHEGYASCPAYSYWDDLWAVKGLNGLAYLANELGSNQEQCQKQADDFTKIVLESISASMAFHKIPFIPGAADLGDFDATSTTLGADPCTLLLEEKKPELEKTFERYWELFTKRENNFTGAYTPYEIRVVGTFVRLGQIDRAWHALDFFLAHRRPLGWKHWAEVVFADEKEPGFLGDAPHGWVASDFLRAMRSIAIYELGGEYFIGAGIKKEMWLSGVTFNLVVPEGIIKLKSINGEISIDGINGLEVCLILNNKFKKVTLPYKTLI